MFLADEAETTALNNSDIGTYKGEFVPVMGNLEIKKYCVGSAQIVATRMNLRIYMTGFQMIKMKLL